MVPSDLKQNIIVTVYLMFTHNYLAIAYFAGFIIGIILSIYKPSRFSTLIFLSFLILLFGYEYDKHIIDSLRQQTLQSLITVTPHFRLQRVVNLFISEILPIFFYVLGWGLLFVAISSAAIKLKGK